MIQINAFLGICDIAELSPAGWIVVDVRDISDFEQDVEKVKAKIWIVCSCWAQGSNVAVRCVCGMNRSCTIAIASLVAVYPQSEYVNDDWDHFKEYVKKKCPRLFTELDLERTAKKALIELYPRRWKPESTI